MLQEANNSPSSMEDSPVNLDDGELWLPSDFFPTPEEDALEHSHQNRHFEHHNNHHNRHLDHHNGHIFGGSMANDLARELSFLNIGDDHRRVLISRLPPIPENLGGVRPTAHNTLTAPLPPPPPSGRYRLNVGPPVDHVGPVVDRVGPPVDRVGPRFDRGQRSYRPGPTYAATPTPNRAVRYPMPRPPVHRQATRPTERLMETRIASNRPTIPAGQLNQNPNPTQNRLLPSIQATSAFKLSFLMNNHHRSRSGSTSASGSGTGVFIPIPHAIVNSPRLLIAYEHNRRRFAGPSVQRRGPSRGVNG